METVQGDASERDHTRDLCWQDQHCQEDRDRHPGRAFGQNEGNLVCALQWRAGATAAFALLTSWSRRGEPLRSSCWMGAAETADASGCLRKFSLHALGVSVDQAHVPLHWKQSATTFAVSYKWFLH